MRKTPEHSPFKGKRTEAAMIGKAGNNAPVGLELHPFERVAKLWRRLIFTNGNFISRRQWDKQRKNYAVVFKWSYSATANGDFTCRFLSNV